jgi:putative membrane protein
MTRGVDQLVVGEWGGWTVHPIWGLSGPWHLGMMLLMLAFWAVVIAGVVLSIRWFASQGKRPEPDPALEILRQRYARGDISKDEFDAKKRDLT